MITATYQNFVATCAGEIGVGLLIYGWVFGFATAAILLRPRRHRNSS